MRQLNGVYTQRFNHRHDEAGHLYQGSYKAILVQKESHLLELTRYQVLLGDDSFIAWHNLLPFADVRLTNRRCSSEIAYRCRDQGT